MSGDEDIKIVEDHPSQTVKHYREAGVAPNRTPPPDAALVRQGRALGQAVAEAFVQAASDRDAAPDEVDSEMLLQRQLLLSFTVSVALGRFCRDDSVAGIAQKSFLDTLKKTSDALYRSSSDTGAFSFYYLAYRRGGDVERRIGQTFAMLCSHDGDPIYQELGEALYCWFSSTVRTQAESLGLTAQAGKD